MKDVAQLARVSIGNVISGHARGVDRAAYEGATATDGHTTVVLPHGMRKLSKTQLRDLQPRIEAGRVLLLSQFHPDAPWMVSRAMERNKVVTGLAQVVIVAESDTKGGTWEGANGALKQKRQLFVRHTDEETMLPGNKLLLEKGGKPLPWPTTNINATFAPLLEMAQTLQQKQHDTSLSPVSFLF
jgi:DNA processing protein